MCSRKFFQLFLFCRRGFLCRNPFRFEPGSFLCQLLRHADNKDARKVVKNICVLTRRLNELEHHWGSQAGQLNIEVPQHVLDNLDKPPTRPKPEELDLTDDPQRVGEVSS